MTEMKPSGRNTDTTAAVRTRVANQARRRHEKYIEELAQYGISVEIPDHYTGQKLQQSA